MFPPSDPFYLRNCKYEFHVSASYLQMYYHRSCTDKPKASKFI